MILGSVFFFAVVPRRNVNPVTLYDFPDVVFSAMGSSGTASTMVVRSIPAPLRVIPVVIWTVAVHVHSPDGTVTTSPSRAESIAVWTSPREQLLAWTTLPPLLLSALCTGHAQPKTVKTRTRPRPLVSISHSG